MVLDQKEVTMSSFANIVIADALGSPVNHTFVPASTVGGVYRWQDMTSAANPTGVPIGYNVIEASAAMSKNVNAGAGKFALDFRYTMPVLESISNSTVTGILPAPTWAYDCAMFIKFVVSARASQQQRDDLYKMGPLAFANAQIGDWCKSYTQPGF
jgi:hypothetical protein